MYFFCKLSFLLVTFVWSSDCLNIISVILGGNPAYEYGIAAPTYDVAFEEAQKTFPGLFNKTIRKSIFRLGQSKTCVDEVEVLFTVLGEIFTLVEQLKGPTVLQTPGKMKKLNLPLNQSIHRSINRLKA
jgi:uncharacterized membrane protein